MDETVRVREKAPGAKDSHGNPVDSWSEPVDVGGVLVAPADPADHIEDGIPDGVVRMYDLYLRDPGLSWRGAKVEVRGKSCDVVGVPEFWPGSPTGRDSVVRAVAYE